MMAVLLMAAAVPQPAAHVAVVVQPDYRSKPSGEDILRFYPKSAAQRSLSGRATIDCAVDVKGSLTGCTVWEEEPVGEGFGQGALGVSSLFKMRPMTVDGVATGGAKVRIPIHFQAPLPPLPRGAIDPTRIVWSVKPTGNDFAHVYPAAAEARDIEGAAVIQCVINGELRLENCAVVGEQPQGLGFGEAALALGKIFIASMKTKDGTAATGGVVRIPIRFQLPH
jgi:TonB family protein